MKVTLMMCFSQSILKLYQTKKHLGIASGWIINPVIDHTISISNYNPLVISSYIRLPKELDHPKIGLINIQNIDDKESFKWCIVRYLNPADCNSARITKADKYFAKKIDFKNIKFPVKIRNTHIIEEKHSNGLVYLALEIKYSIHFLYQKNVKKHLHLSLTGEEGKKHYVLFKDFNTFMYDHTLHRGKKHFCYYCIQAFRLKEN